MSANNRDKQAGLQPGLLLLLMLISGAASALIGFELADFYDDLLETLPPREDPYLAGLSTEEIDYVLAGRELYSHLIVQRTRRPTRAGIHLREFQRLSGTSALIRE